MGAVGFKVPSGIGIGNGVHKQLHIFAPAAVQQEPAAVGINPTALIHFGKHFQNAGGSVQADIFGNNEIHIRIGEFQLIQRCFLRHSPGRNAVGAAAAIIPECRAAFFTAAELPGIVQLQYRVCSGVNQTNNVKDKL